MASVAKRRNCCSWRSVWVVPVLLASVVLLLIAGSADASSPEIGVLLLPGDGGGSALSKDPVPTILNQTMVEVKVPANSTLTPGVSVKILACADADGKSDDLPVSASTCDGLTINTGRNINVASNGSIDKTNYTIYKLPLASESSDPFTVCGVSSACVLYIGQDQNDFSQPHVWSQPFLVSCSGASCDGSTSSTFAAPTTSSSASTQSVGSNAVASAPIAPGNGTEDGSGPSQLAATGATQWLSWLAAGGVVFLATGFMGRRHRSTS